MSKGIRNAPPVPESLAITLPQPRAHHVLPPDEGTYPYKAISSLNRKAGSGIYPVLDKLLNEHGLHWTIVNETLDQADMPVHEGHSYGLSEPTFRDVDAAGVTEYYVDGVPNEAAF